MSWPKLEQEWPEGGTWGYTHGDDDELVKVWDSPPAPSAGEVSNRREPEPIEIGRRLSPFQEMEREALGDTLAAATTALEEAEMMLEGLTMLRAATHQHRQIVVALRDAVKDVEGMRSVFNRTLDRDTQTL